MLEKLQVGILSNTHGLRGEVKVIPTTEDKKRFLKLPTVLVKTKEGERSLEVECVRFFKELVILKFRNIDNINDVLPYKGCELYVERKDAIALGPDEYFVGDLIGLQVWEQTERKEAFLGKVKDVLQTGANDVYIVDGGEYGELLIPAIRQCILGIDVEKGVMTVKLLQGIKPEKSNTAKEES